MKRYVIFIGPDLSSIVGDTRVIASEVMSFKALNFHILYLVPNDSVSCVKEQIILRSDSSIAVLKYFIIPLRHIHQIIEKLYSDYNPKLIFITMRNINLVKKFAFKRLRSILLIDNLRYVSPAKIYNCTGDANEALKCISGTIYYNALSLVGFNMTVSKSCKNALLWRNRVLVLPPCYVEIYPERRGVIADHEVIHQKLQLIKDAKDEGCTVVLHAKVFGPRSGRPPKVWYRTLGFYSFVSLYIMAKHLKDCLIVTWDATSQLFDFYMNSLNLPKLPDNVVWLPWIPQEYINELYKMVDIVTIPRLGWHGYGVTTSLIEALYFGKPILTTSNVLRNLGLDTLQHDGLIAEDNVYAWPRILKDMVKKYDPRDLGAINRKIYDKLFSLPVRAKRLKRLIDNLLEA